MLRTSPTTLATPVAAPSPVVSISVPLRVIVVPACLDVAVRTTTSDSATIASFDRIVSPELLQCLDIYSFQFVTLSHAFYSLCACVPVIWISCYFVCSTSIYIDRFLCYVLNSFVCCRQEVNKYLS